MNDQIIEQIYAQKYNTNTTSRKDIGDIYVDDIPINIKSTHIDRNNYSPNLVSADKLFDHLSNKNNKLQFLFVKYNDDNIIEENIVDAEHISWECLVIRCQGRGVIQMNKPLKVNTNQTRETFLQGMKKAYKVYISKEHRKLDELQGKYCQ